MISWAVTQKSEEYKFTVAGEYMARARETRALCPPDNVIPFSPISGRKETDVSQCSADYSEREELTSLVTSFQHL